MKKTLKRCITCLLDKKLEDFKKSLSCRDGRLGSCKFCNYHLHVKRIPYLEVRKLALDKERKRIYNEDRKRRYATKESFRIAVNVRNRVNAAIKLTLSKKHTKTSALLGCSWHEYVQHIESTWLPGMNWGNYGVWKNNGPMTWHIDHIIPCAAFDLTKEEEQRKCFHWSNTRALWAKDNIVKNDNLCHVNT